MPLSLTSPDFQHMGTIPKRFTCDGADVSPTIRWSGVPAGTRSLALIIDDPDAPDPAAPKMVWVHWILYNLPAGLEGLPEAVSALPTGALEGLNDWKRTGWGGPCPPIGRHRYFFKLYALDTELDLESGITKAQLLEAMENHILAEAQLMGKYKR